MAGHIIKIHFSVRPPGFLKSGETATPLLFAALSVSLTQAMHKSAHFRFDPKLAHVLGESCTSSEKALKELVDNAWDAGAIEVHVTVKNILTDAQIIVQDNGSGMKTAELEAEYLNTASPRFSRSRLEFTPARLR